jgi:hypothetical protein
MPQHSRIVADLLSAEGGDWTRAFAPNRDESRFTQPTVEGVGPNPNPTPNPNPNPNPNLASETSSVRSVPARNGPTVYLFKC